MTGSSENGVALLIRNAYHPFLMVDIHLDVPRHFVVLDIQPVGQVMGGLPLCILDTYSIGGNGLECQLSLPERDCLCLQGHTQQE